MAPARKLSTKGLRGAHLRIVQYLNDTFDGNLRRATEALRCDYDQLYRVVRTRDARPNVLILLALERHSGRSVQWWMTGGLRKPRSVDAETALP